MLGKSRILAVSSLLLLGATTLQAADFQQGLNAYSRGDYKAAFAQWQPLANEGNARAQKRLGDLYKTGSGVPQDYREAVNWYQRAANQGNADAQNALGVLYMNGQHVNQNFTEAMRVFKLAATQGNADAMNNLGIMYTKGLGMSPNPSEAEHWYSQAAAKGHISAQHNLAFLRNYGAEATQGSCSAQESSNGGTALFSSDSTGVTQISCEVLGASNKAAPQPPMPSSANSEPTPMPAAMPVAAPTPSTVVIPAAPVQTNVNASPAPTRIAVPQATSQYRTLAEQGDAEAQYQVAEAYRLGRGVPQDFILAYTWYNLAASQGISEALTLRDQLAQRMTPSQLEQGQGLSRDYFQRYVDPFH